ncbi:hypothetical protein GCM10009621_12120 [Corynebacterium felinum]|uniref:Cardiolipin synthase N-terminal domain-containing protein n=1 Tax=Corynebacterium felinum TaxID=131318 RepID=A0ABU2BBP6_9CORY|nr:hypothetical protein [Corynebacterium felinum]
MRVSLTELTTLSPKMKKAVCGLILFDVVAKLAAWHFLYHLPADRIRGKKRNWVLATVLTVSGSPWFLIRGIKR